MDSPFYAIGIGETNEGIKALDKQLFEYLHNQEKIAIENLIRSRRFVLPVGHKVPEALLAISLHYENQYYGVLWVGFQESEKFPMKIHGLYPHWRMKQAWLQQMRNYMRQLN